MSIQTSDADLKAAQLPVMDIDGNGNISNMSDFAQNVNIGTNTTLYPGSVGILSAAGKILGTISEIVGIDDVPNKSVWTSGSSGIVVKGQDGVSTYVDGANCFLQETDNFTANTTIYGGNGNVNAPNSKGGSASLGLKPDRTSWTGTLVFGADSGDPTCPGGSVSLGMSSTQTNLDLNVTIVGGSSDSQ